MSIAKASQVRRGCDGFVIANHIANGSQNIASNRHSVSSSVSRLVETPHHGVAYVTRESVDGMMR